MPDGRVSFRGEIRGVNPGTKADRTGMARADVIIENGTVVGEGGAFPADVVIAEERIDATGLWLIPGGIDTHTHFEEPDPRLLEGFASGGAAAAAGGLTSVVEMPQAHPTTVTPELLRQK